MQRFSALGHARALAARACARTHTAAGPAAGSARSRIGFLPLAHAPQCRARSRRRGHLGIATGVERRGRVAAFRYVSGLAFQPHRHWRAYREHRGSADDFGHFAGLGHSWLHFAGLGSSWLHRPNLDAWYIARSTPRCLRHALSWLARHYPARALAFVLHLLSTYCTHQGCTTLTCHHAQSLAPYINLTSPAPASPHSFRAGSCWWALLALNSKSPLPPGNRTHSDTPSARASVLHDGCRHFPRELDVEGASGRREG